MADAATYVEDFLAVELRETIAAEEIKDPSLALHHHVRMAGAEPRVTDAVLSLRVDSPDTICFSVDGVAHLELVMRWTARFGSRLRIMNSSTPRRNPTP